MPGVSLEQDPEPPAAGPVPAPRRQWYAVAGAGMGGPVLLRACDRTLQGVGDGGEGRGCPDMASLSSQPGWSGVEGS